MHITSGYVLDMFSDLHIPLIAVWYLMYNDYCTWHTTSDDEQIIFHLVLQVYCSPSLKEHLHNPVMSLMARTIQRKESILCAHGGVCSVGVCAVAVCEYMHVCLCVACGCMDMCTYYICVFIMVDTNLQEERHVPVITQVQ